MAAKPVLLLSSTRQRELAYFTLHYTYIFSTTNYEDTQNNFYVQLSIFSLHGGYLNQNAFAIVPSITLEMVNANSVKVLRKNTGRWTQCSHLCLGKSPTNGA